MSCSVVYLMSGTPHLPYLVVSLSALRQVWPGRVQVFAWPESIRLVERIARDPGLDVEPRLREPEYRGKNGQFLDKIRLMQTLPDDVNLYLDADTIPVQCRCLENLFMYAESFGFCATQFCRWTTAGGTIRRRVGRMVGREGISQRAVQALLDKAHPSLNGGVFACRPGAAALRLWERWTKEILDVFIADETALHAVMAELGRPSLPLATDTFDVATGGAYNCSPAKQPADLPDERVGVWHGHGDSFVRPNKSRRGVQLWWPRYRAALADNTGGLAEWKDEALAPRSGTSRFLRKLESGAWPELTQGVT